MPHRRDPKHTENHPAQASCLALIPAIVSGIPNWVTWLSLKMVKHLLYMSWEIQCRLQQERNSSTWTGEKLNHQNPLILLLLISNTDEVYVKKLTDFLPPYHYASGEKYKNKIKEGSTTNYNRGFACPLKLDFCSRSVWSYFSSLVSTMTSE